MPTKKRTTKRSHMTLRSGKHKVKDARDRRAKRLLAVCKKWKFAK